MGTIPQAVAVDRLRMQKAMERAAFNRLLGLELMSAGHGAAVLALDYRPELSQAYGYLHGGALASLADVAVAVALIPMLHKGEHMATIELSIQYLLPVTAGMRVEAAARVLRRGKAVAVAEVDIRTAGGEICAKSLMSYRIFRGKDLPAETIALDPEPQR
ncbi:MAG: PaaI family thioesterase [Acidobacteria bacterium]|nr:PaaI family thioesterase [Acidobacteriota bacterium]